MHLHTGRAAVQLQDLTKHYGAHTAVDAFSLAVAPGSMTALLGPSGCGKTTCLRMIAGLVQPSAGEIYVDGKPITRVPVHRRNIGMLFQNYALFPHMTVAENVSFGLEARHVRRRDMAERVADALQIVRLTGFEHRMPSQLSGGEQQRVALARALVVEPALLLLDEPLGALDKSLRESMQVELRALQHRLGITTIMVTHDQEEALTLADQIAIMCGGRLEQVGTPTEIYEHPVSRFVASFIGVSNFFRARVERRDGRAAFGATADGIMLHIEDCTADSGHVTVAVRPEAVSIDLADDVSAADANCVPGTVEQVVYRGFINHVYLRLPNGESLVAYQPNHSAANGKGPLVPGATVRASWSPASNRVVHDPAAA